VHLLVSELYIYQNAWCITSTLEAVLDIRSAKILQTCSQFTPLFLNFFTAVPTSQFWHYMN